MTTPDFGARQLSTANVLIAIAGIYVTQSLVGSIMFMGVPAVLRDSGIPLDRIGLTALFMLPWTVKFLWAPFVERFRLPVNGRRRSLVVIVTGQVLIVGILALLSAASPGDNLTNLLAGLAAIALVAATLDIACDGFTVEQLRDRIRGWGNVMQVGGGYLGMAFGAGLFLVLAGRYDWQVAMLAMAGIAALLTLPAIFTREPRVAATMAAERPSLRAAFARAPIRWGLALVALFQVAPRMIQAITGPFLIDQGADLALLGTISGSLGIGISLAGVLLAGLAVRRWSAATLLQSLLVMHAIVFLATVAALSAGKMPIGYYFVLTLAENAIMAGAFVVLYTAAMQWSSLRQAGIDFTLFQCADAATAALAGLGGSTLAHHAGYQATFILAIVLLIVGALLLPTFLRRIEPELEGSAR